MDEMNTNQLQTEKKEREKKDLIAKIEDLEMTIDELTKAIEGLKAEIAEMQVQLKRAGEDREKQNREFQSTVADQREAQKMLQAALNILAEFYGKAALLQQEPAGPPPPAGFESYKKNAERTNYSANEFRNDNTNVRCWNPCFTNGGKIRC